MYCFVQFISLQYNIYQYTLSGAMGINFEFFVSAFLTLKLTYIFWITKDHGFSEKSSLVFYWRKSVIYILKGLRVSKLTVNISFGELFL